MVQTIEVEVGDLHANLHEQLSGMVGEQYDAIVREKMETLIHDTYREVERQQEQQDSLEQKANIEIEDDE